MFSLFKKKNNPASELYNHYSEEEKLIILSLLFAAASCDNTTINFDQTRIDNEIKYLNSYVDIFNSSATKANQFLAKLGPDELLNRFISMGKSKTDDALILILGMLTSDGQLNETELVFLSTMLEKLNISDEDFIERIKKLDALYKYFMK